MGMGVRVVIIVILMALYAIFQDYVAYQREKTRLLSIKQLGVQHRNKITAIRGEIETTAALEHVCCLTKANVINAYGKINGDLRRIEAEMTDTIDYLKSCRFKSNESILHECKSIYLTNIKMLAAALEDCAL